MNVVQCRNLLMISFLGNGSPMIPFFFFAWIYSHCQCLFGVCLNV